MTSCKELHTLLKGEILVEIENVIAKMAEYAAENELTESMQEEQNNIHAIQTHFNEIVNAIENESMQEEDCERILEELHTMRQMGEQAGL
jgi:hypothetical protein